MKKITLGLITLLVMCFLVSCGNSNDSNNDNAKKEVIAEIQQTLDQNDVQVLIAFGDNFDSKESLIQSSELHSDGLIALCTNPEAIERTELTAEQQVQIAKIGEFAYNQALLLSTNLTAEGLVAICENPGTLNLKSTTVQKWFKEAIERTELTAEQQAQIAKSEIKGMGLF